MAKLLLKEQEKKFKTYLEENIFHTPLSHFHQFRGGMASYSFYLTVKNKNYVVKILKNTYIHTAFHDLLEENIRKYPFLKGIKMDKVFKYDSSYCTIQQNYGKTLPRRKFNQKLLKDIINAYKKFSAISYKLTKPLPILNNNCLERYQNLSNETIGKKDIYSKFISYFLSKITPDKLSYHKKRLAIIHGDFNNNQILLKKGKLSAFIDWDNLRLGYPAEDYWEFIYFNLRRLRLPILSKYWLEWMIEIIEELTAVDIIEWEYAIAASLISHLEVIKTKRKVKYLLKYLYLHYISKLALKKLKKINNKS